MKTHTSPGPERPASEADREKVDRLVDVARCFLIPARVADAGTFGSYAAARAHYGR